ncbi:hypothetical protein MRX96_024220 [Rhipicephalus microplus]
MSFTSTVASVITSLQNHLQHLSAWEFRCLDDEDVPWLPRLEVLPLHITVREIVRVLEASATVSLCLRRVAWFYCWLMPRNRAGPWMLYRFDPSELRVGSITIVRALSRTLPAMGRPTTFNASYVHGTLFVCMIMRSGSCPTSRRYTVVLLVLRHDQRCAVGHAETPEDHRALATALHVALYGSSVEVPQRMFADIDSAFSAVHTGNDGPIMLRVDSDPSIAAPFVSNSYPQEQEHMQDLSFNVRERGEAP